MCRAEVGAVAAEDVDPLLSCVVDGLGDEMGGVRFTAAGHRHVRRSGTCGLAQRDVGAVNGVALRAVDGGRVAKLDVLRGVLGRDFLVATAAAQDEPAVATDVGDGPGLAVGDLEIGVIAAGGDAVADLQLLAAGGRDAACVVVGVPLASALVADGGVQVRDLLPSTGDDQIAAGTDFRERRDALDIRGVDGDLSAAMQLVEHAGRILALPHLQT